MLHSRLDRIAADLDNEVRSALHIAALAVEAAARERVPVDSGALRDAIHITPTDDGCVIVAGNNDAFYGHIVEHGSTRVPPRPFLTPAAESVRDNIDEIVRAGLKDL